MGRQVHKHTYSAIRNRSTDSSEAIGEWSATCNRANQENLLLQLALVAERPIEVIAERLGITATDVEAAFSGKMDLTLTELRLLSIASDTIVSYSVRAARPEYSRLMRSVTVSYGHDEAPGHDGAVMNPVEYARRAVASSA